MPSTPRIQIVCYPTKEEYNEIESKARKYSMSLSKYLIFCGINSDIEVKIKKSKEKDQDNSK